MKRGRRRAASLVAVLACAQVLPAGAAPPTGGDCAPPGAGPLRVDGADLVLHDATGSTLARWPLRDADGRPGTPIAVCRLQPRQSVVVVVAGWHELWEISTDPAAPPIFDGLVHDYRMGEAIARPGYLGVRRIRLATPWTAVWADGRVPWLLGREAGDAHAAEAVVLHLDIRRVVLRVPLGPLAPEPEPLQGAQLRPVDSGGWTLRLPAPGGGWQWIDTRRWQRLPDAAPPSPPPPR